MKEKIIKLRNEGKTYDEIRNKISIGTRMVSGTSLIN